MALERGPGCHGAGEGVVCGAGAIDSGEELRDLIEHLPRHVRPESVEDLYALSLPATRKEHHVSPRGAAVRAAVHHAAKQWAVGHCAVPQTSRDSAVTAAVTVGATASWRPGRDSLLSQVVWSVG